MSNILLSIITKFRKWHYLRYEYYELCMLNSLVNVNMPVLNILCWLLLLSILFLCESCKRVQDEKSAIFRKQNTIFRKQNMIFKKQNTIFRRQNIIWKKEKTIFRKPTTIFRKQYTIFRKLNKTFRKQSIRNNI